MFLENTQIQPYIKSNTKSIILTTRTVDIIIIPPSILFIII